jgi:hypothetical protein
MKFKKIAFAAVIYMVLSILIGYFVPSLESWATIIAALVAGIYVGFKSKSGEGFYGGIIAGLVGGILGGVIMAFVPSFAGIPIEVSTSGLLSPTFELIEFNFPWVSILALIIIGAIFGGIGGILGSREKLGRVFLFLTLFFLFIFYGALDNVAWNWGRYDWTWNMSVSHVLTNSIDLFIAAVFAVITTFLAYILLG